MSIFEKARKKYVKKPTIYNTTLQQRRSSADIHSRKLILFFWIVGPTSLSKHSNRSGAILTYLKVLK